MRVKTRTRIDLKLFKDGKRVFSTSRRVKARILTALQGQLNKYDSGTCRVWYDVENDYWNEFEFTTFSEFKTALDVDTELDLLREFSNVG